MGLLALFLLIILCVDAAPIVLDFRNSLTTEDLQRSHLQIKKLDGFTLQEVYFFPKPRVSRVAPGAKEIRHSVSMGEVDVAHNSVVSLNLIGAVMPHDQVYAVSKDPAAPVYPGARWWLWALGGVALISAALWLVWRAYRKKN